MAIRFSTRRKIVDGTYLKIIDKRIEEIEAEQKKMPIESPRSPKRRTEKISNAFAWQGKKPHQQLEFFHQQLIDNKFIAADTPIGHFKVAFSGYENIIPLKIKWIAKGKNKLISKTSLFYFIELLVSNSFLLTSERGDTGILYNNLQNIFVDADGNNLKNLKQSNSQKVEKPKDATLRDIILSIPK